MKGCMLKLAMGAMLCVAASASAGSPSASEGAANGAADTVYVHGRIYTVDTGKPWATAVAITEGKFRYVGDDEGARAFVGPKTRVIDLGGKMAMPGIQDSHQHLLAAQERNFYCEVDPESDVKGIIAALKSCPASRHQGGWIVANVYRGDKFPGGVADRKYLDAAFPNTPVYIREWSYHHAMANSAALRIAGITRRTPDPEGGKILHRSDGEPTGEFLQKATFLIAKHIPPLPEKTVREALLSSAALCSKWGITSVQDAATTENMLVEIQKLDREGRWPLRTATHLIWGDPGESGMSMAAMDRLIANRTMYRSPHLFTDYVKIFIDGSPLQPHATDAELRTDNTIPVDRLNDKPEVFKAVVTRFDRMGIKVKMHAVGTAAVRMALDAIEAARKANGNSGILHDVAHTVRVSPQDLPRYAQLGAVAEMSPAIWQIKGPLTENLAGAWQFRSLHERGTLITAGTDWVILPSPNLFPGLMGIVDHGDQSLDLKTAIEVLTINGAKSLAWDKINGSIEVGKLANMIVLDRNLFEIPTAEIGDTKVLSTIFEGRVVYQADGIVGRNSPGGK